MPKIIPIKELKNTGGISQLCHTAGEPVFITKNGYGDMVLMSMEIYEKQLSMLDVYQKLHAAEEQVADGKMMDADSSLRNIRAKYGL